MLRINQQNVVTAAFLSESADPTLEKQKILSGALRQAKAKHRKISRLLFHYSTMMSVR